MTAADWYGSIGVALLLAAFFLNLFGRLPTGSRWYPAMNTVGAGLACYASFLLAYPPFVVLEGTWSLCALVALFRPTSRRPENA
ncbi:MAG: hypothetical protein K8J08_17980 [Thermoanaerobaculia bacterium]|nr:hypothetical protein [Thermoanaerobaculia bacterium]